MFKFTRVKPLQQTIYWLGGVGLGAAIAIAAGLPTPVSSQTAAPAAQGGINSAEVQQYADSVLRIESLRTVALRAIQPLIDGETLQGLACHQSDAVRRLPNEAKEIFVNYCSQSIDVVEQNGLSITRFNEITAAYGSNSIINNQIQRALQEIQAEAVSRSTPSAPVQVPADQTTPETAN